MVTGGGSGIGRAACRRFAAEGPPWPCSTSTGTAPRRRPRRSTAWPWRWTSPTPRRCVAPSTPPPSRLGGLSILVNNAGGSTMVGLADWDPDEWDRIVRLNLTGVFNGMRAGVPHLLAGGGGAVVNTASISATRPSAGETPYSAAKAGVIALTASAALEYGPVIRVNAVAPGMIRTNLTRPLLEIVPDADAHYRRMTPAARVGEPEDVADVMRVPVLGPGPLHHGADDRRRRRHDAPRRRCGRPLRPVLPGRTPPSTLTPKPCAPCSRGEPQHRPRPRARAHGLSSAWPTPPGAGPARAVRPGTGCHRMIEARGLTKRYGEHAGGRRPVLRRAARPGDRLPRSQRVGQVHHHAHGHGARPPRRRERQDQRPPLPRPALAAARGRGAPRVQGRAPGPQRLQPPVGPGPDQRHRPRRVSTSCSSWWAWPRWRASGPGSSPSA